MYLAGQLQQAEKTIIRLHQDPADPFDSFALAEFRMIKAQLDLEASNKRSLWDGLRDPHMRKRFIVGFLVNNRQAQVSYGIADGEVVLHIPTIDNDRKGRAEAGVEARGADDHVDLVGIACGVDEPCRRQLLDFFSQHRRLV